MSTAQQKALDAIFKRVAKKHGDAITTMDKGLIGTLRGSVASPLTALNHHLLGVGGFAYERMSEVFGPESSGKSSLVMGTLASVQKTGGIGYYVDAENVCTQERAKMLGLDTGQLLMSPDVDSAEQAGQLLLDVVNAHTSDVPLLAAWDSVPAFETEAEAKGDVGDNFMSPMARFLSGYLRKLTKALRGKNAHVIFVNQIREKPGVMFGNPEYTPGGKALKFYASIRLRTRGVKPRDGGLEIKIKSVKNKLTEPGRELTTFLHFQKGWDDAWTTLNHAKDQQVVAQGTRDSLAAAEALGWVEQRSA